METTEGGTPCPAVQAAAAPPRRHAAGADPAKRAQILAGALQLFLDRGFEAASMGDIARAAGVSKGTLYVYFQNKEDLFESLIEAKRDRMFQGLEQALAEHETVEARLLAFGKRLAVILCSDEVLRAQRIVLGALERMPELGERFYAKGAERSKGALAAWMAAEVAAGRLAIPDVTLAASQFAELCTAGIWRRRLFGRETGPSSEAEMEAVVASAVRMFLAAYGTGQGDNAGAETGPAGR
ncbi:TetR/AcrR family transcriptional regulator [Frigidibacter sp. MR17.24]|uniref:TetR/AcrR family transcriptional regulator n=1 Tax=Frigidibacter sp. MR17.24 TaxID=3127345 RepID=UPI0030130D88